MLAEGEEIQVTGLCQREAVPAGMGLGGGCRDLPTCLHIRAPRGGELLVRGVGSAAPRALARTGASALTRSRPRARLAGVVSGLAAVSAALYWLLHML